MHFLFHGSADWKFKAKVLEGPKLTGGSGEDSAAVHSLGGFSNKVGLTFSPALQFAVGLSESGGDLHFFAAQ